MTRWPTTLLQVFAFALAFVVASVPSPLRAQANLNERAMTVAFRDGAPVVSFSARDLVDGAVRRSLASGLGKHVVVTVQAYRRGQQTPLATRVLTCRVTYDLWEEAYVVRRGRRTENVRTVDDVVARCLAFREVAIGEATAFRGARGGELFFAVRAEFNPIAAGNCPRLLRSPSGDDPLGPVVVNIVRREICQAERAVEFRSAFVRVP